MLTGEDSNCFASSVLAYPSLKEQIYELYGGDYFIIPSSLHEVLTVPDNGTFNADDLAAMVRQVNQTVVEPQDILSDSIFHYSSTGLCRAS